jgi:hypothetical protein
MRIRMLDFENVDFAFEISFLSHLEAEIYVLSVWGPPYWFPTTVCSDGVAIIPIALPNLQNVTLAVGISFLSHLEAHLRPL